MRDSCVFKYRGPPFTGASTVEGAAAELSRYAGTVVVKLGREGALTRAAEVDAFIKERRSDLSLNEEAKSCSLY